MPEVRRRSDRRRRRHVRPARGRAAAPRCSMESGCGVLDVRFRHRAASQAVDLAAWSACAAPRPPGWRCRWRRTRRTPRGRTAGRRRGRRPRAASARTPAFCGHAADEARPARSTGRPLTIELLKLRATASHSPRRISARRVALLLGVDHVALGEDEQRPAMRAAHGGAEHDVAHLLHGVLQRGACWSRNEPVPAAHSPLVGSR